MGLSPVQGKAVFRAKALGDQVFGLRAISRSNPLIKSDDLQSVLCRRSLQIQCRKEKTRPPIALAHSFQQHSRRRAHVPSSTAGSVPYQDGQGIQPFRHQVDTLYKDSWASTDTHTVEYKLVSFNLLQVRSRAEQSPNNPAAEYSVLTAKIRGFLFYLWTFTLALPLFVTMLAQAPFVAIFDKHR